MKGEMVVSVSIDATVRQWSLKGEDLGRAKMEAEEGREGLIMEEVDSGRAEVERITEEEERELEALMDDQD